MKTFLTLVAASMLLIFSTPCFSEGRAGIGDGGNTTTQTTPPAAVPPSNATPTTTTVTTTITPPTTPAPAGQKPYATGDKVQVLWQSKWYPATVKSIQSNTACIHYDGYASSWDECVTSDRIKFNDGSTGSLAATIQPTTSSRFVAGEKVSVLWQGSWYAATVMSTNGSQTCIHYDGYASSWDECVSPDRIKKK